MKTTECAGSHSKTAYLKQQADATKEWSALLLEKCQFLQHHSLGPSAAFSRQRVTAVLLH